MTGHRDAVPTVYVHRADLDAHAHLGGDHQLRGRGPPTAAASGLHFVDAVLDAHRHLECGMAERAMTIRRHRLHDGIVEADNHYLATKEALPGHRHGVATMELRLR